MKFDDTESEAREAIRWLDDEIAKRWANRCEISVSIHRKFSHNFAPEHPITWFAFVDGHQGTGNTAFNAAAFVLQQLIQHTPVYQPDAKG